PFFAMMAFSIDVGWMYLTKAELQNAADSASLAGASQLATNYVTYNLPDQVYQSNLIASAKTSAGTYAKLYASNNSAGGVRSLSLVDGYIEYGFTDAQKNYSPSGSGYPNTVKVVIRRDSTANGPLNLFLATILGMSQTTMTATAAATATGGSITSF